MPCLPIPQTIPGQHDQTEARVSLPEMWEDPGPSPNPQPAGLGFHQAPECLLEFGGAEGFQKPLHMVR